MKKVSQYNLGRRLKELRESLEVSQGELAESAQMDQSLLSRYEREDVSPSWLQVERLLEALGQSPCSLFTDLCSAKGAQSNTFKVPFYDSRPMGPDGMIATTVFEMDKAAPFVRLLHLVPTDERYFIARSVEDAMIPHWYPGDLLLVDTEQAPNPDRVVIGFFDGEPMIRRLIRHKRRLVLMPSNRHFRPLKFEKSKWQHKGVVMMAGRDLIHRYVGDVDEAALAAMSF